MYRMSRGKNTMGSFHRNGHYIQRPFCNVVIIFSCFISRMVPKANTGIDICKCLIKLVSRVFMDITANTTIQFIILNFNFCESPSSFLRNAGSREALGTRMANLKLSKTITTLLKRTRSHISNTIVYCSLFHLYKFYW
jgi:hypothetical protein